MIIYEVNLVIDGAIYSSFQLWLKEHIKEMLQFPGFIKASILKPEGECASEKEKLTIQYQVEDRDALTTYFTQFAAKMREAGVKRFQDKFSVERRVFEVQDNILK